MAKFALIIFTVIALNLISVFSLAQDSLKTGKMDGYLYFQPNFGASQYFGDLNGDDYRNRDPQFAFGAVLGYQLSPVFGFRGQFLKADLYSERSDMNQVFYSELWDGSLNLTINLNEIFVKYNETRLLNFYLFSGAGITSYKSTIENIEPRVVVNQHPDKQHELFVPVGGGVSFRLDQYLSINLEYGDHITFSGDGLDFTAEGKKNDHYSYTSFGIQVKYMGKDSDFDGIIDKKDACPEIPGKVGLAGCPDTDNDGIADKDDVCPDTAGDIKFRGCPDSDGDSIIDREDDCPYSAGKKELNGCPDKDNDSVADKHDKCPEVPGKKELAGCPDRDNDGIADNDDLCPDSKGLTAFAGCPDADGDGVTDSRDSCIYEAGIKELNGCPDSDHDSIADKYDKCPDVPGKKELAGCPDRDNDGTSDKDDPCPDIKGPAKFFGCPDTDGDGIPDNKDNCPKVPGIAGNFGCPGPEKEAKAVLQKTIYFGSGSSEFLPTFGNTISLDEILAYMKENPDAEISVSGHEDGFETGQSGVRLSEKRADYIIDYLQKKGIKSTKIKKSFFGKNKPLGNNNTSEGRTLNRRVEIKVIK
jgi:outer membrane protein OmpA-like peptidoglycan-associated protein